MNPSLFLSKMELGSLPHEAVEMAIDIAAEQQAHEIKRRLAITQAEHAIDHACDFPKTEQTGLTVLGCSQSLNAPEGPGSGVNKPLMRKPRAPDERLADRDTAENALPNANIVQPYPKGRWA